MITNPQFAFFKVTIEGAIVSSADVSPAEGGEGVELFMDTGQYHYFDFLGVNFVVRLILSH